MGEGLRPSPSASVRRPSAIKLDGRRSPTEPFCLGQETLGDQKGQESFGDQRPSAIKKPGESDII